MEKLGIIGGMGPLASAYLYERITLLTKVACDQDHIEILLHSIPSTPDRSAFILDPGKISPVPSIAASAKMLIREGCSVLAIPCVTAHSFLPEIRSEIETLTSNGSAVRLLDMVGEVADELERQSIRRVGIMATSGTVRTGTLTRALAKHGIEAIIPSEPSQDLIMRIVYDFVKCGRDIDMAVFHSAADELFARGAQMCVLGCTELSLANRARLDKTRFIDAVEMLAKSAVVQCGGRLRYI